ncbi:MAG: hypothetical protein M2R45_04999 [Verrucomicrobia subdivision 3 bacterium]|nr:hypothetical protein [Limisphaerales bacterium]MCS1415596.1 hypothetical protein [Limisphaerales bacterium]
MVLIGSFPVAIIGLSPGTTAHKPLRFLKTDLEVTVTALEFSADGSFFIWREHRFVDILLVGLTSHGST